MSKRNKIVLASVAAIMSVTMALSGLSGAVYASPTSQAQSGFNKLNQTVEADVDLEKSVGTILTMVYSVVGIIAVVMVVIGGINYATSQGDSNKVKKGKDTILYGIIGLVIVLLAFAITNFVLANIGG